MGAAIRCGAGRCRRRARALASATMSNQIYTVIGATGAMGRPVVKHLLAADASARVRVVTRDPRSPEARGLAALAPERVEFFAAAGRDEATVQAAVDGAAGVFCNTNFFASVSVEAEYAEGVAWLHAARRAGVAQFVWSSLDSMGGLSHGRLPCPHFDAKAAVAAYIDRRRADDYMRRGMPGFDGDAWFLEHTGVLVTLPYIENFKGFFRPYPGKLSDGRDGLVWTVPLGDAPLPMVALDDIGAFATILLTDPRWRGRTLAIGSETLTMHQVAETFTRVTGVPAEYHPMSLEDFTRLPIPFMHDFVHMLRFFREVGLPRDHAALRQIHPGLRSFESWLRETGWRGEPEAVFKSASEVR